MVTSITDLLKVVRNLYFQLLLLMVMTPMASMRADFYNQGTMCFLNKEKGLSGASVSSIMSDDDGQMWILTSYGINRYNGRRIVHFPIEGMDSHLWASDMCLGGKGEVYVACREGLLRLRRGESKFRLVDIGVTAPENLFYVDGRLYIGCHSGLYVYDGTHTRHITVAPPVGLANSVRQTVRLDNGTICFATREAINFYVPSTGKVSSINITHQLPHDTYLSQIAVVGRTLYIGTKNNGLYAWSLDSRVLRRLDGVGNVITRLGKSGGHLVTVSTDGSGAYLIDGRNGKILKQFNTRAQGDHQTPTNAIYCYYRDGNGVDWLGYARYGASYIYHSSGLFRTFGFNHFTSEGIDVRSFCLHGPQVLIGSYDGLYFIDRSRSIVRKIGPEELNGGHIVSCITWYDNQYYISTFDGGILRLDPQTLRVSKVNLYPSLSHVTGGELQVSPDGKLWMCTSLGVFVLNQQQEVVRYTEDNAKIYGGLPSSIRFDQKGKGWLTFADGMVLYNVASGQFGKDNYPAGFFNRESVKARLAHDGTLLFFGRKAIYRTDADMKSFGLLPVPDEIAWEGFEEILQDRLGHYWIVSDLGLFRLDARLASLQHFGYGEGMRSQLVNGGMQQDRDGRVWLGTSNGLLTVEPRQLDGWMRDARYHVVLYDIRKDGSLVEQGEEESVNNGRRLSLHWNFASQLVTMKPILEDFARPNGRLYEYRLQGDSRWQLVGDGQEIVLKGLFLGKHHLQVRLAGAPGTMRSYHIVVVPSVWAVLELVLVIVALVLLWLWRRYRMTTTTLLDERNEIADALVDSENEKLRAEEQVATLQEDKEAAEIQAVPKYEHVKIDEEECRVLVEKMRQYIEANKLYTDPNLKMSDLADYLRIPASRLSQIFRLYMSQNYYEFINAYRLAEFKRLVAKGEDRHYTITALSERSGFKRSNFFSTFRRMEGMTPVEYLKKMRG